MESMKMRIAAIRAFVRACGEPIDDVEDIVQDAFLRLHVYAQTQPVMQEDGFLKRTVRNLVVDRHRRRVTGPPSTALTEASVYGSEGQEEKVLPHNELRVQWR
jgi:DNA-directed RNA polymerase specialized sigma24 family protein